VSYRLASYPKIREAVIDEVSELLQVAYHEGKAPKKVRWGIYNLMGKA